MTSVATNVTSIVSSHFPFDDYFCAFGSNLSKRRLTRFSDSLYFSSYASLFDHDC